MSADFRVNIPREGFEKEFAGELFRTAVIQGSAVTEEEALALGIEISIRNKDDEKYPLPDTFGAYPVEIWVNETTPIVVGWEVQGYGFPWSMLPLAM